MVNQFSGSVIFDAFLFPYDVSLYLTYERYYVIFFKVTIHFQHRYSLYSEAFFFSQVSNFFQNVEKQ